MQACNLNAQLAPVTGLGQSDMSKVELHVKIGVFNPVGPIQAPGHLYDSGAKQWHFAQAPLEAGDDVLEADEATGSCGWVVDSQTAHMLWRVGLLEVDKRCVKYSQLSHVFLPLASGEVPVNGGLRATR